MNMSEGNRVRFGWLKLVTMAALVLGTASATWGQPAVAPAAENKAAADSAPQAPAAEAPNPEAKAAAPATRPAETPPPGNARPRRCGRCFQGTCERRGTGIDCVGR
jgi:hypothetical protein